MTFETAKIHILLTLACAFMLCYDYFYSSYYQVRIKKPQFILNTPYYNYTSVKTNDVYEKLIDIKNFTFLLNPQPCKEYPAGLLLLIIVSSKPTNYRNRKVIRNTWGKAVHSTRLVFLIGETNTSETNQIKYESAVYGDIVQGTFTDAYRNMTYKHVMGLKWVVHHCPVAKYIMKTDDDVVLNSREIRRFISKELSPWGARNLIVCREVRYAPAQREDSKWVVTKEEYAQYYYPTYCLGLAILYSFDVVSRLLDAAQTSSYYWIDDVHVSGILAEKIGVPRTAMNSLILSPEQAQELVILGSQYVGPFLLGPPDLNVSQMLQLWSYITTSFNDSEIMYT